MESFNGRFKEENHSLFLEAQTLDELIEVVNERMRYYNEERRHSSIGYLPPLTFIERVRSGREGVSTGSTTTVAITTALHSHSDHMLRGSQ